jgi:ribulose 1,5-bisphosphate carboxylase large subunit-like protein
MQNPSFIARYRFAVTGNPAEILTAMAHEQTTTGYDTIRKRYDSRLEQHRAEVRDLTVDGRAGQAATGTASVSFPLLNVSRGYPIEDVLCFAMGESSHVRGIKQLRLVDLELPPEMLERLPGPTYGVEGMRKRLGVDRRPFLMGPLRPEVGFSPRDYAFVTQEALTGGADIIKDDELLADPGYCPISERAGLCARAARDAEQATGEGKHYILNVGTDLTNMQNYIRAGADAGVDGFMIHPRLTPSLIPFARSMTEKPLVVHYECAPTFSNGPSSSISFGLLAKLYRLSGGDLVTYPRPNKRFDIHDDDYRGCLSACLDGSFSQRRALPTATGGNDIGSVRECSILGKTMDYVYLSGSTLLEDPQGVRAGATRLRAEIERLAAAPH